MYDRLLNNGELYIVNTAKPHAPHHVSLLRTIPGVGNILAVVLWDEIPDISRFPRVSDETCTTVLVFCPVPKPVKSRGQPFCG